MKSKGLLTPIGVPFITRDDLGVKYKYIVCKCNCGNITVIRYSALNKGTKSCGCALKAHAQFIGGWNKLDLPVEEIKNLYQSGVSTTELAKKFNTCKSVISQRLKSVGVIIKRKQIKGRKTISYKWSGYEEISGSYWAALKAGAKSRNIIFDITIEYIWNLFLQQNRKCAITGIQLEFAKFTSDQKQNASLDRIDNTKGYIIGNVWWVQKDINKMKNTHNIDYFIKLCTYVSNYNQYPQ